MMAHLKEILNEIKDGAKQNHKNMTIYRLLSADETPVDFITLDAALATGPLSTNRSHRGRLSPGTQSSQQIRPEDPVSISSLYKSCFT